MMLGMIDVCNTAHQALPPYASHLATLNQGEVVDLIARMNVGEALAHLGTIEPNPEVVVELRVYLARGEVTADLVRAMLRDRVKDRLLAKAV